MLYNYHENNNAFNQIVTILANNMSKSDFTNCNYIGENECDTLCQYLKVKKHLTTVNTLRTSLEKFSYCVIFTKITRLILMLKVKCLIFNGINHDVYKHFMKTSLHNPTLSFYTI